MWRSIAVAIAAVTCGALVRLVLDPILASDAPLLVFILAVVAGAHYSGYGAALLTTVLAATTGTFLFIVPAFAVHMPSAQEWVRIVIFVVEGVIIATVFHRLRRTEEQAQSSRDDLARFVSFITHELRNPLNAITAATELLVQSGNHPRAGTIVQRQVAHLSTLLRDLSDELRIGRMALDVRPEYCDIEAIVRDAIDMAMPEMSQCGQSCAHRFSTGTATVWGDLVRLRQVFANLLVNASRYAPENGNIRLELTRSGPNVIVDVADDGIGLSSRRHRPYCPAVHSSGC